jgi:SAM-dependent methyltransferase
VRAWHEDDDFWEVMAPKIFGQGHWNSAPAEVECVISLLKINPGAYVLDLCCGPGRHSLELARRGFRVVGVDRTSKYIEEARKQAEAQGLNVEFLQEDMRNFCRPETYDAALNLYTSFGYFENPEEDRQVLKNVYSSLKKGGKLVIDVMGKEVLARIFRERDWHEEDGIIFLEERKLSNGWSRIQNRWIMIKGEERKEFTFSLRLYSGEELSLLLSESGFNSVELFGDLSRMPYDHTAKRLVALAIK